MGEMKRISELLDDIYRPLCTTCGMIPKNKNMMNENYCHYCEMTAEWCQCDVSDMCKCGDKE